jgi:TonB family protein
MPKPSITRPPHRPEASPKEKAKEKPEVEKSPKTETPLKSKAFTGKPNDKDAVKPSPSPGAHSAEVDKGSNDRAASGPAGTSHANTGGKRSGGTGSGVEDSALSAYVGVLTNRFQAAWNQPTGEISMGKTLEVTVKLKVEADGTVTEFTIMAGSGNAVVDESVREAGKRITKLPPPPNNQAFSAPVRFELGN